MIVLSASELTKEYGTDVIFRDISFHLEEGDRVGLVGINGAGKTTLLDCIMGEKEPSAGRVVMSDAITTGYLKQQPDFSSDKTVMEVVEEVFTRLREIEAEVALLTSQLDDEARDDHMELAHRLEDLREEYEKGGGYTYKSEINGVLSNMAFSQDYLDKPVNILSGGEKTRLALSCLLLAKPDLLLLDEPTNHLDIGTLKWLEQYLSAYRGTILVVSHDRYFLDQTVNRIFELDNHKMRVYKGGYSSYAEKRRVIREEELRHYNRQQEEIKRQEDMIRRFKERGTEKLAKRAASREKRLEKIERLDRPDADHGRMKISFKENYKSGTDVIKTEGLAKSFGCGAGRRDLFENVDMDIKRGERICIVGPNGVGKTTMLKILLGQLAPSAGEIKKGYNLLFGYYDQEHEGLNPNNTVFDEMKDAYALYKDADMRSILGRFMFRDDDVFLPIRSLSGGEKSRLALAKIMLSGANVLIFDEPTNHLDIDSKEVFEEALLDFPGTVITVSHDRYFLNRVPTRILELNHDGITQYLGNYDYYVEKKQEIESGRNYLKDLSSAQQGGPGESTCSTSTSAAAPGQNLSDSVADEQPTLSAAEERRLKKENEAKERRRVRRLEELENLIMELESEIEELGNEMMREEIVTDHEKLREISDRLADRKLALDKAYAEWAELEE